QLPHHRFFCRYHIPPPNLHSFPTRRSSDLAGTNFVQQLNPQMAAGKSFAAVAGSAGLRPENLSAFSLSASDLPELNDRADFRQRSEEHTSELQSPDHLVCRLLLEKKNK